MIDLWKILINGLCDLPDAVYGAVGEEVEARDAEIYQFPALLDAPFDAKGFGVGGYPRHLLL